MQRITAHGEARREPRRHGSAPRGARPGSRVGLLASASRPACRSRRGTGSWRRCRSRRGGDGRLPRRRAAVGAHCHLAHASSCVRCSWRGERRGGIDAACKPLIL